MCFDRNINENKDVEFLECDYLSCVTVLETHFSKKIDKKTFSCRPVRYFGTLFWDDITKFWDENLLLFTFLTGKLRKNLFWTNKKFVYLNIITNFRNIVPN